MNDYGFRFEKIHQREYTMLVVEGRVMMPVFRVPRTSVLRVAGWSGAVPRGLKHCYGQGQLHILTLVVTGGYRFN